MPLTDGAIWALSLADSTLLPGHIGYKAWITYVADVDCHWEELAEWAKGLALAMSQVRPLLSKRRRLLVTRYDRKWGDQAALDGLHIALYGIGSVNPVQTRSLAFECDRDAYRRIRDPVSYTHLTLPTTLHECRSRWSPYH